jgi:hypothetical protein
MPVAAARVCWNAISNRNASARSVAWCKAIKLALEDEGVLRVALKLGISRKWLHDWIKA